MLAACRLLVLVCCFGGLHVGIAGAQAAASAVDSVEHQAFIEGLPAARAAVQEAHAFALENGVTAEMHEAQAAIVAFLERAWLDLAAVWPPTHFGTATHQAYVDAYKLQRIAFYRAINSYDDEAMEGSLLGLIVGARLLKDLDQLVADTATAQLSRHDPVVSLEWLSRWQAAAR